MGSQLKAAGAVLVTPLFPGLTLATEGLDLMLDTLPASRLQNGPIR